MSPDAKLRLHGFSSPQMAVHFSHATRLTGGGGGGSHTTRSFDPDYAVAVRSDWLQLTRLDV